MQTDSSLPAPAMPPPLPEVIKSPPPSAGIGKVILLCLIFYGITVGTTIVDQSIAALTSLKPEPAASLFFQLLLAWPLTLWISLKLTHRSWKASYASAEFQSAYIVPSLLSGFGLCILLSEAATVIPMPDFVEEFFMSLMQGSAIFVFFGVCLVAPVMEELFFRGLVLRCFIERYSLRKAAVASSLLFALFHLNPWQAIVAFPVGMINAWLVFRTGSLVPGILLHFATNTTSSFLLNPLGALFGFSPEEMLERAHFPWQLLVIGTFAAAAGLLWLFKLARAQQPVRGQDVVH